MRPALASSTATALSSQEDSMASTRMREILDDPGIRQLTRRVRSADVIVARKMCLSTRSHARGTMPPHRQAAPAASALALLALLCGGGAAAEPCKLGRAAQLPVTMEGMRPLVHAAINGQDALFIADSGAFFSSLTPAAAKQ